MVGHDRLCFASLCGGSGCWYTRTLALWGKLKSSENSCLFCVYFVFLTGMFGIKKRKSSWQNGVSQRLCLCQNRYKRAWLYYTQIWAKGFQMPQKWPQLRTQACRCFNRGFLIGGSCLNLLLTTVKCQRVIYSFRSREFKTGPERQGCCPRGLYLSLGDR